jgi:hypothetical protein
MTAWQRTFGGPLGRRPVDIHKDVAAFHVALRHRHYVEDGPGVLESFV